MGGGGVECQCAISDLKENCKNVHSIKESLFTYVDLHNDIE